MANPDKAPDESWPLGSFLHPGVTNTKPVPLKNISQCIIEGQSTRVIT